MKISELEGKIASARVIDTSKIATDKVLLYSKVEMKNITTGAVLVYNLVPESESDIASKKISISSPIGKGLLGKKVGDIAEISVPSGVIKFEIITISKA